MAENKGYMQYAMLFGTYLGGYWILKFILFPFGPDNSVFIFPLYGTYDMRSVYGVLLRTNVP